MNTTEKNTLAQELSLFLYAKYEPQELNKELKKYQIHTSSMDLKKRASLTKTLQHQKPDTLLKIVRDENIKAYSSENPLVNKIIHEPSIHQKKKIFISHASEDKKIIGELIDVLELIGIDSNDIYCSSFEGYGTPLGQNYLEVLKKELNSNVLVLFVLSHSFFKSELCLCEMGAAWVLSQKQIPIYIPPFRPEDVKGVFPVIQGFHINNRNQINLLKQKLESEFKLQPINQVRWGQRVDKILRDMNTYINQT